MNKETILASRRKIIILASFPGKLSLREETGILRGKDQVMLTKDLCCPTLESGANIQCLEFWMVIKVSHLKKMFQFLRKCQASSLIFSLSASSLIFSLSLFLSFSLSESNTINKRTGNLQRLFRHLKHALTTL